jgi:hypothetical protein
MSIGIVKTAPDLGGRCPCRAVMAQVIDISRESTSGCKNRHPGCAIRYQSPGKYHRSRQASGSPARRVLRNNAVTAFLFMLVVTTVKGHTRRLFFVARQGKRCGALFRNNA